MPDFRPEQPNATDVFGGPGGWNVAARQLGIRALGIEWDSSVCDTRRAAGPLTLEEDVRNYYPLQFDRVPDFIASPPCQTFSAAGKGAGRAALDIVYQLSKTLAARQSVDYSVFTDERTGLVLEPLRWVLAALDNDRPYEWLAFEQVPAVLPVWEYMAEAFQRELHRRDRQALRRAVRRPADPQARSSSPGSTARSLSRRRRTGRTSGVSARTRATRTFSRG